MDELKYIWWLSQGEMEALGPPAEGWPAALQKEYRSMQGRPLRGRLWGETGGQAVSEGYFQALALGRWCAQCGGLVIKQKWLPLLRGLPGTVTDFELQRVDLGH